MRAVFPPMTGESNNSFYIYESLILLILFGALARPVAAHGQSQPQQTIGQIDTSSTANTFRVAGAVSFSGSSTLLANGSTVTAGPETLPIRLTRGGELDLCSTTSVHLSEQQAAGAEQQAANHQNTPLMIALDQGAIEAHYALSKNSDVVLTPDLRILLSGPGKADVSIRVNAQGDTCVDNRGDEAPYVTVGEQIGTGIYRVQPNQRVLFEHGSVRDVVDQEPEPCGCPAAPVISVASAGTTGKHPAKPGRQVAAAEQKPVGGPSSTPADTAFPVGESEGLAAPPPLPDKPVVPPGQVHAEVTTTLAYSAPSHTVPSPEDAAAAEAMTSDSSGDTQLVQQTVPRRGELNMPQIATPASAATTATEALPAEPEHRGGKKNVFHKVGHFFAHLFGYGAG